MCAARPLARRTTKSDNPVRTSPAATAGTPGGTAAGRDRETMPTRMTGGRLALLARALTSGALVLTALSWGMTALPASSVRPALAEDMDCYNDKDLYDLPECVQQRANDAREGNQSSSSLFAPNGGSTGQQASSDGGQPAADQGQTPQQQPPSQQSSPPSQQANNPPPPEPKPDDKPQPSGPTTDPWQVVLTLADAGKEAVQFLSDEGTDKYGRWARTRYERDRTTASSTLGPNVVYSKVWIAKDPDSAKALYKEQAAVKDFPERTESVAGPVEKVKPTGYGEENSF